MSDLGGTGHDDPGVPVVATTTAQLKEALAGLPAQLPGGRVPRRAVVMTMGALHSGHLALVRRAVATADQVVVTVFVNPLQFGQGEDYETYPRTLDADVALLTDSGVAVVFAPEVDEIYPGYPVDAPLVRVTAGRLGTILEGAVRPGHFDGVLTVVLKLLNLVAPDVAVFGHKDAQQLLLIRRMVHDLNLPVVIESAPIVRDHDGLALSSRNAYLTEADRSQALALNTALGAGADAAAAGAGAGEVHSVVAAVLDDAGIVPDYLVIVDPATVDDVDPAFAGDALILVAARVGATRLLDNRQVTIRDQRVPGTSTRGEA